MLLPCSHLGGGGSVGCGGGGSVSCDGGGFVATTLASPILSLPSLAPESGFNIAGVGDGTKSYMTPLQKGQTAPPQKGKTLTLVSPK